MSTDKIYHIICIGFLSLFLPAYTQSQNIVSGNIQSIPSMTNAYSGITFKEINTNQIDTTTTDSLSGNFTKNLKNGIYEMIVKTIGHRRYIDTITIDSDKYFDLQMIEWIPTISTYFTDALNLANCLLGGYGSEGGYRLFIWRDEHRPVRVFHENRPADTTFKHNYETAKKSILDRTSRTAKFREADTDSTVGVRFQYKPRSQIPGGASGYAVVDTWNPDLTPKHMTVTIANDEPYPSVNTYLRELCRVLGIFNTSPDEMHVMFIEGTLVDELSIDEGNALNILYKLKLNTDTRKYKPIKDTTITEIKETREMPQDFTLEQNCPNPFNPNTNIEYQISKIGFVTLKIYDILGREAAILVNEVMQPGEYSVSWNAENAPSGVYYYRLSAGNYTEVKKMLLLK